MGCLCKAQIIGTIALATETLMQCHSVHDWDRKWDDEIRDEETTNLEVKVTDNEGR